MASSSSSNKSSFTELERKTLTVSEKIYDAFINHRGPDVKDTVAFALYESLEEKECWTFLDDQELQLGDLIPSAIQNAIYSSKVQIAIFSPGYAESSWCLDELLLMLKTKAQFIPIFCDVKPSDLRYPDKGVYAPAFAQHEEKGRFSDERLHQWKEALHSSSLISGYEFSTSNENVERLCTKIALAVQKEDGKMRNAQQLCLSSCVCEILGYLIRSITQRSDLHAEAATSTTSTSAQVKVCSLPPRDSHSVGIESKVEHMVGLLEDPGVQVIAVVGMGGSGKTFLLQNVFKAVKSKNDYSIWLSISKSYSLENLQHDIASHIGKQREIVDNKVSKERAAELIHDHLLGKRCLIVLDDLWTLSTENSLIDKLGLPTDKDCKVVISTRNRQVALNSNARIYEMKNLSDEDSWRLFCVYAFPNCVENRAPLLMEEEGRKIVKQCGNLPLAIKTIAASLANTRLLSKWVLKRRQLERVVTTSGGHDPVMEILKLSYDALPAYLKACFAYLSFFPEDEEIDSEYLINLWIAEGFIPAGEDQWDLGWDWLDQLDQLCLIQVCERGDGSYLTKYCKIHDLLHDLAIHISKENRCALSVEEVSRHTSGATGWCRILLAKKGLHVNPISESRPIYLRTLTLSQNEQIASIPDNLFTTIRGLRVLDLSFTDITTLPASLGKMILLKLLNLKKTNITKVPKCVRHLKGLLFLALPLCCRSLPVWISELKSLQHFEGWGIDPMPKGISKLASLRTLRAFFNLSINEDEFMRLGDVVSMTQLQELRLILNHDMELERMEEGILAQLLRMRRLAIRNNIKGTELPQFPENITAMKQLEYLLLQRFVVPRWICKLTNLRELWLQECSDYSELERMPNLVGLYLNKDKSCRKLPEAFGKSGGFPQLRFLQITNFSSLEELPTLEEGAMVCLEQFLLFLCPKVKKVEGLEQLKRLEEFSFYDSGMMSNWWKTLYEDGEYWKKIKAINPQVNITAI
ncbi:hypothetical protein SUGI_1117660 [Cryptomeria japonica]|uniref:probable disease resistance protein At1g61300 n=1 Tax=Cryptomeria japonica TaxID=3369 RepID=UPI0024149B62|nr:probable disease resistance protein At1g61300 [Cryptomeria japonica]GLJ52511.1 hypothetical protein SUGI_1117660 [Cryptomeria japonica]